MGALLPATATRARPGIGQAGWLAPEAGNGLAGAAGTQDAPPVATTRTAVAFRVSRRASRWVARDGGEETASRRAAERAPARTVAEP